MTSATASRSCARRVRRSTRRASRARPPAGFLAQGINFGVKRFTRDRRPGQATPASEIEAGQAKVIGVDGDKVARLPRCRGRLACRFGDMHAQGLLSSGTRSTSRGTVRAMARGLTTTATYSAGPRLPLREWVNSGLMTFFFFVLGLEARRELDLGELRERRRLALPVLAAIGGMGAAIAIYLLFNLGSSSAHGWGIAMSTDTALALGLLALSGRRVPERLRAFILTVVVVDDLLALVVIATAYTDDLQRRRSALGHRDLRHSARCRAHWCAPRSGVRRARGCDLGRAAQVRRGAGGRRTCDGRAGVGLPRRPVAGRTRRGALPRVPRAARRRRSSARRARASARRSRRTSGSWPSTTRGRATRSSRCSRSRTRASPSTAVSLSARQARRSRSASCSAT